jgi:hypothetical protein
MRYANGTIGSPTSVVQDDRLGAIFHGAYHSGLASGVGGWINPVMIASWVDGDPSTVTSAVPGRLTFYTTPLNGSRTERVRIDSTGKVGIGTTSPVNTLSIGSTSAPLVSQLQVSHPSGDWGIVTKRTANDNGNANFAFLKSRGEYGIITAGDYIGRIGWHAVTGGSTVALLAELGVTNVNYDGTNADSIMYFSTKTQSGSSTERVRIDQNGNVGIGTTNPIAPGGTINLVTASSGSTIIKSQTSSVTTGYARYDLATGTANSYTLLALQDNTASPYFQLASGSGVLNHYYDGPNHIFRNVAGTVRVTINSSGNVGIGETDPGFQLHIKNSSGNSQSVLGQYGTGTRALISAYANQVDLRAYNGTGDALTFTTGSTERLRIDTNGNVTVGYISILNSYNSNGSIMSNMQWDGTNYTKTYTGAAFAGGWMIGSRGGGYGDISFYNQKWGTTSTAIAGSGLAALEKMRIDTDGNLGIGATGPKTRFQATGAALSPVPTLGTASGTMYISNSDVDYGMLAGVTGGGSAWIQVQRTDTTATAYDLLLQPSGGNVGIGTSSPTGKLHVKNGSNAIEVYPTGTWAGQVYNATDSTGQNGLVVGNRWAADTSTAFEVGSLYGGGTGSWRSWFKVDGIGQSIWSNNGSERMRIDSSGRVTMPYQTGFHASYGSITTQSWSGTTAYQVVQLNGQATVGSRTTGYNTTSYRFTAPVAGMYMLYSRFTPSTNTAAGPEAIYSINGSGSYYAGINYTGGGLGSYVSTSANLLVQLAANDWVEFRIANNNSSSFTLDLTRCAFGGYLVG